VSAFHHAFVVFSFGSCMQAAAAAVQQIELVLLSYHPCWVHTILVAHCSPGFSLL
jgi:hypothetical protein